MRFIKFNNNSNDFAHNNIANKKEENENINFYLI